MDRRTATERLLVGRPDRRAVHTLFRTSVRRSRLTFSHSDLLYICVSIRSFLEQIHFEQTHMREVGYRRYHR